MADKLDQMLDAAERRGRAMADEPRAMAARYDPATGQVIVDRTNGCAFAFPARMAEGLEHASDADLAAMEIIGSDYGLHWEVLERRPERPAVFAGASGRMS